MSQQLTFFNSSCICERESRTRTHWNLTLSCFLLNKFWVKRLSKLLGVCYNQVISYIKTFFRRWPIYSTCFNTISLLWCFFVVNFSGIFARVETVLIKRLPRCNNSTFRPLSLDIRTILLMTSILTGLTHRVSGRKYFFIFSCEKINVSCNVHCDVNIKDLVLVLIKISFFGSYRCYRTI